MGEDVAVVLAAGLREEASAEEATILVGILLGCFAMGVAGFLDVVCFSENSPLSNTHAGDPGEGRQVLREDVLRDVRIKHERPLEG